MPYDSTHKRDLKKKKKCRIRPVNTEDKRMVARGERGTKFGQMEEGGREIWTFCYGRSESQE